MNGVQVDTEEVHSQCTVKLKTLASRNFDEFGKSEWICQSLTNQYIQISAFSMKMSINLHFVSAVAVRICQSFSLPKFPI